jgi:hypothetical protein
VFLILKRWEVIIKSFQKKHLKKKRRIARIRKYLSIYRRYRKTEEIIVVSAHYDHVGTKDGVVYNGADDDGSGTVAVMEIAEAFQQAKKQEKDQNVLSCFFM